MIINWNLFIVFSWKHLGKYEFKIWLKIEDGYRLYVKLKLNYVIKVEYK